VSLVRTALRQPLFYFVLLGAAVFAIDAGLRGGSERVLVSPGARAEVRAELEQTLGRAPTDEELGQGLERWLDTELLFREAMTLGLDQDDAVIRAHLAQKLGHVVRERAILDDPSDAELQAQLDSNRARYTSPDRFDVTHVFVGLPAKDDHHTRVELALGAVRADADPKSVGDHFPRGPAFNGLTRIQLEQAIGAELATALEQGRRGQWQQLSSARGTHLVRIDAAHSGEPSLDSVRSALVADVNERRKQAAVQAFTRELRKKYAVHEH
jgi:hypothetical protein